MLSWVGWGKVGEREGGYAQEECKLIEGAQC